MAQKNGTTAQKTERGHTRQNRPFIKPPFRFELVLKAENVTWRYNFWRSRHFLGRSCSLIFRSRVGSLVSKKIPSPRFSPGSCPKAPASPPVLFVNEYQKPPVLPRFSSQMPPVLPRFFWAPPGGQKFSIKLSALSVGFPQRRPFNLIKRPQFINPPGGRFINHPACSL